MTMQLGDDGTLDTVIVCSECGVELRYNWDGGDEGDERDGEGAYKAFVEWAKEDAADQHDIEDCHAHGMGR